MEKVCKKYNILEHNMNKFIEHINKIKGTIPIEWFEYKYREKEKKRRDEKKSEDTQSEDTQSEEEFLEKQRKEKVEDFDWMAI